MKQTRSLSEFVYLSNGDNTLGLCVGSAGPPSSDHDFAKGMIRLFGGGFLEKPGHLAGNVL